jgi:hypothetical protein
MRRTTYSHSLQLHQPVVGSGPLGHQSGGVSYAGGNPFCQ